MKRFITPVALAVAMALGAAAAQAQMPVIGTTAPCNGCTQNNGLYLAVWDDTTKATDLIDLTSLYPQVSLTKTSIMDTPTPGSGGWSSGIASPIGGGTVYQYNLGTISNFSSVFPLASITSNTQYLVVAANNNQAQNLASAPLVNTNPVSTGAIRDYANAILGQSSDWYAQANTSPLVDKTGTAAFSAIAGPLGDGDVGLSGASFSVGVGTAAGFYSYLSNALAGTSSVTPYSYTDAQGQSNQGFWFLSDTGNLSWNLIASTVSAVPLPPAVWLFASGLIGLALIGRRRQTGLGSAA